MSDFISDYLITTENSEAPPEYHIWCMLSTLSVFAGRRFWFPFGSMVFYPNLYVVLVGDPGMRKSTAMNRAKGMCRAAKVCPIAATQTTKEAMSLEMSSTIDGTPRKNAFAGQKFFVVGDEKREYNQYAIFATELTQFIGVNPLGFLDFLTTVWDEPFYEVTTKNKGCDYVVGPYITLLACMTPEIVKGYLKMNILTGGFARRTAFVFSSHKNVIPIPTYTKAQMEAEVRCVEFGQRLQERSGPFGWTDALREYYEDWYRKNASTITDKPPTIRSWYESKHEMLFKVSMLIALAYEEEQLILDLHHFKSAERFCDLIEKNLPRVFEGSGINPNAAAASQICRMLEQMGKPMNKKHLQLMFYDQVTDVNALNDTLTHLATVGRLEQRELRLNGQLLGTIVGSPGVLSCYSDADLVQFLGKSALPPHETDTDSQP